MPEQILCGYVSEVAVNNYYKTHSASPKDQGMSEVRFVDTWFSSVF
jgi:hypothetical protein